MYIVFLTRIYTAHISTLYISVILKMFIDILWIQYILHTLLLYKVIFLKMFFIILRREIRMLTFQLRTTEFF